MITTAMMETVLDPFEVPLLLQQVVIALAIGGLIGLEREKEPGKFAGLRTLALLAACGPIFVLIGEETGSLLPEALYLGLAVAMAIGIAAIRFVLTGDEVGFTTSVTVVLVGLLGLLVGYGRYFEATSVAIIAAFLLAEKESLVRYVDNLTYEELTDSMKLAALVFILYPILPAASIDPYGVVFPREVLLFAIFVLLIEFAAYISMRQFGTSRGLQVTGLLAGMANSFATAGVMARMANRSQAARKAAASGLMLSVISMIIRNVGLASIIAVPLIWLLAGPGLAMLLLAAGLSIVLLRRGAEGEIEEIEMDSPFSFQAAAKFAAIYVAITVVSVLAQEQFGEAGVLATAYLGGLVSSAAVAVSAGSIYNQGAVTTEVGAGMVMLGIMASLTSKCVLVELINGKMRWTGIVPMILVGLVGLAAFSVTWFGMFG